MSTQIKLSKPYAVELTDGGDAVPFACERAARCFAEAVREPDEWALLSREGEIFAALTDEGWSEDPAPIVAETVAV